MLYKENLLLDQSNLIKYREKLHFITINYTQYYTLYPKLFECTFCTLNYNHCYTLHPNVKFTDSLDGNSTFMMQIVVMSII